MGFTATILLVAFTARVLLDSLTRTVYSIQDFILVGIWQGIGLHYSTNFYAAPFVVGFAIAVKAFIEFQLSQDTSRLIVTILGVALGGLCTEFLSQLFDSTSASKPERRAKKPQGVSAPPPREKRVVQFCHNGEGSHEHTKYRPPPEEQMHTISDITSVDSSSEMLIKNTSMTPAERLEREIKTLRMRASLADSERRRFKEERKWAISQGNEARAEQMKWQVKRYTALMQSFHREADAKLIEASGGRPPPFVTEDPKPSSSRQNRPRREPSDGQTGITVSILDTTQRRRTSNPMARENSSTRQRMTSGNS